MKIIFLLFIFCNIIYADPLRQISIKGNFNDKNARNTAYNTIVNYTTACIKNPANIPAESWDVSTATTTEYWLNVNQRYPGNLESLRDNLKDTVKNFIINNNPKINTCIIKIHTCYINDIGNCRPCSEVIVYQK